MDDVASKKYAARFREIVANRLINDSLLYADLDSLKASEAVLPKP